MQGKLFLWFCDPGRSINVISVTTVTVTQEGGAKNCFLLSKTLHLQEMCRQFAMGVNLRECQKFQDNGLLQKELLVSRLQITYIYLLKFISKKL